MLRESGIVTKALRGGIDGRRSRPLPVPPSLSEVQLEVLLQHVLVDVISVVFWGLWQQSHPVLDGLVFNCAKCRDIGPLLGRPSWSRPREPAL